MKPLGTFNVLTLSSEILKLKLNLSDGTPRGDPFINF